LFLKKLEKRVGELPFAISLGDLFIQTVRSKSLLFFTNLHNFS